MKTDLLLEQIQPQALELEESVLASCLLGDGNEAVNILRPEDFYRSAHQKVFSTVCDLTKQGVEADLPLVVDALRNAGELANIGGAIYLATLVDRMPVAINVGHYAQKIKNKSILRAIIKESYGTIQQCFDESAEPERVIDKAREKLQRIENETVGIGLDSIVSFSELAEDSAERYEELARRKGSISGIASGFYLLDHITCGFQKSDLIVLAARPSMGKTALALNIAGNVAKEGVPVGFFSLEMSRTQLFDRQIAGESSVNSQKFRSGNFKPDDWQAINDAQARVYEWPVFIDDGPALHYSEIRRRAWKLKKTKDIRLIIIDHLQLIRGDNAQTRDREIASITAGLKATAKELNVPIILLSQLNRALEMRPNPDKRPRMSDLRDSGCIEQDADVVMFLYRPKVYGDEEEFEGHAELNIGKQRNGPVGRIKLLWHEKTTTFKNLSFEKDAT
jgi:replicative DNA helicase